MGLAELFAPLPLGIAAGLFLGKQLGIFAAVWLSVRFGLATKLRGATWLQIYAVAVLCGIGFTMSLFIGALAFPGDPERIEEAKIGVLAGSFLSAIFGYLLLRLAPVNAEQQDEDARQSAEIDADGDVQGVEERTA
jgi:NhaA family Na+:H+ antiporter